MKEFLFILVISCIGFYSCKKEKQQTGIQGKWFVTSDSDEVWIGPSGITHVFNISEKPWFQFNNDGTGSYMRDTTGKGAVVNFTYTLDTASLHAGSAPSTLIKVSIPPQMVDGAETQLLQPVYVIEEQNSQVLKIDYSTNLGTAAIEEFITMSHE